MIQVQDRRYRKNAADLTVRCRAHESTNEQEFDGDLQRKQKVHEKTIHGLEASDAPYTWCQHPGWQDTTWRDIHVGDVAFLLRLLDGIDAETTRAGATGVEEARIDLQCSEG